MSDRAIALNIASYVSTAFKNFGDEIVFKQDGIIVKRAQDVLKHAHELLQEIKEESLFKALEKGRFAEISRTEQGGKGLQGVF